MLCVDVNVLLEASFTAAARHESALALLESLRTGAQPFGIPSVVASGFLRIATRRDVFAEPKAPEEATAFIDSLLASPTVSLVEPGPRHWEIFRGLVHEHGLRGPDIPDAYLAALAIERGATWISYDRGFARFRGLRWLNPADEPR